VTESAKPSNGSDTHFVDSIRLLGLKINRLTMDECLASIDRFVHERIPRHIVTADASMVVLARDDRELARIVLGADLVTPDGAGILWASRFLGSPVRNKVSGVDLVEMLCRVSSQTELRLYFLGAGPQVAATAAQRLTEKYPGANIVGTRNGYFGESEEPEVVREIAETLPDVLFVAFGIPKQEKFIDRHKSALGASVCIGVGGSFDVYSGLVKRAPVWMQNAGLEWIFRLYQNPKKISKVMTLPKFVIITLWSKLSGGYDKNETDRIT
jgi:N-acetylglucosaminyldiphosphoundecaprenol N-acetyl-beta-D-mannosaminyltransferase